MRNNRIYSKNFRFYIYLQNNLGLTKTYINIFIKYTNIIIYLIIIILFKSIFITTNFISLSFYYFSY